MWKSGDHKSSFNEELQLEGKKRMDTASFLRGYPVDTGLTLGDK